MRHQRLRVELRLNGELKARYQGRYGNIAACGARAALLLRRFANPSAKIIMREARAWMQGFFDRPSPPLWKALGD